MSSGSPVDAPRVPAERFERHYASSSDPWGYCTSEYERTKYSDTLAALPALSYTAALEIGCSIGVFTELLAPRCARLVAFDFAPRAVELARERVRALENVELMRASFPEDAPAGPWDLIVCSEVLYYLDRGLLESALEWLETELRAGACVLAVSWRGRGREEPMRGDEVHDLLGVRFAEWHALDGRRAGYRLDRFDGHA